MLKYLIANFERVTFLFQRCGVDESQLLAIKNKWEQKKVLDQKINQLGKKKIN